jgi:hypothetical protein
LEQLRRFGLGRGPSASRCGCYGSEWS